MPSISQAELDNLKSALVDQTDVAMAQQRAAEAAETKLRKFDAILDKIKKAAQGQSLAVSSRDGIYASGGVIGGYANGEPPHKIKTEERQAQEIRDLNEQVAVLRSRIAAVVAVAEFAKEHKA